jgi:hypothetical protein
MPMLFALGCGESGSEKPSCYEGSYTQCVCPSGAAGSRLCANGALGACVCAAAPDSDPCDAVRCDAYQRCVSGYCEPQAGRCDSSANCGGDTPICDPTEHRCVADEDGAGDGDGCDSLDCEAHQQCALDGEAATCEPKSGFCDLDADCASGSGAETKCNEVSHLCVDPCSGVSCAAYQACVGGTCALAEGRCTTSTDCATVPGKPECNTQTNYCVASVTTDPCNGVTCQNHQSCHEGTCAPNAGRCDVTADCAGQASNTACDTATHTCVNPCVLTNCDASYQQCVAGNCVLQAGKCATDGDCAATPLTPECDTTSHTCVADDPCTSMSCGAGATCSTVGDQARCNCPHGQWAAPGSACAPVTSLVQWCGIHWIGVDGWSHSQQPPDIQLDQNAPSPMIYAWVHEYGTHVDNHTPLSGMRSEMGYTAQTVTYPIESNRFTWVEAVFNAPFICSGNDCNNHEYQAAIPTAQKGTFHFIFRFSKDSGATWAYCDKGGFITDTNLTPGMAVIE